MKSFRRNRKGQLVIIAALIMIMFTLALVYSISQINLRLQELRHEPFQETALSIASDFDRCLIQALKKATHKYNETRNLEAAETEGNKFIAKWVNSTLAAYSNLGIEIKMNASDYGATDVRWVINWNSSVGVSYVYTRFSLNINAYGFKGWKNFLMKSVWLNIIWWSVNLNTSVVTLYFNIMQSIEGELNYISNIKPENIQVTVNTVSASVTISNTNLTYLNNGVYSITFKTPSINIARIILTATTPDGIIVSACTSGEWKTIYLTNVGQGLGKEILVPLSQFLSGSGRDGFVTTPISHGQDVVEVKSIPTTENIILPQSYPPQSCPIQIQLFLDPSMKKTTEVLFNVTFGFEYNGAIYWIGSDTTCVDDPGPYIFHINPVYPEGYEAIPEGSILILRMAAISDEGFGSIKVRYGPAYSSLIQL